MYDVFLFYAVLRVASRHVGIVRMYRHGASQPLRHNCRKDCLLVKKPGLVPSLLHSDIRALGEESCLFNASIPRHFPSLGTHPRFVPAIYSTRSSTTVFFFVHR